MENLYLIVGLGNPGADYSRTRHNAGFLVIEELARRCAASWTNEKKFRARLAQAECKGRRVCLCEPQTYMNASGEAVVGVARYYDVAVSRLLVIVDDADLPLGHLRLRPGGSSGGHHGLESIEQHLGTREYARQRLGIGRTGSGREITGHVLGRFSSIELALVDKVISIAASQAETWLESGVQKAMNQFNGVVENPDDERKEQ